MLVNIINFFLRFVIQYKEEHRIKHNLIDAFLICLIIFIPDVVLRFTGRAFINIHVIVTLLLILFSLVLSFSGVVVKFIVGTFLFVIQFTQFNYMYFGGMAIEPSLIPKIIGDSGDILDSIKEVLPILPFAILPYILFLVHIFYFRKKTYFAFISIILVIAFFSWLFYYEKARDINNTSPKPTRQTIRNSLATYGFFLTHITNIHSLENDLDLMKKKAYKPYEVSKINNTNNENRIIILIWGESTNAKDMHIINKKLFRNNTPYLEKFAENNEEHFMFMNAISGATATRASAPLFFNMIREPGNTLAIKEMAHNLFKMAKDNGYKTHWLSSQGIINAEDSSIFADNMHTQENHGYDIKTKHDDYLIELFKELDLSKGKHLIVLNPNNTHLPYYKNYEHRKEEFRKFTDNKTRREQELSAYHNCILYLDWWINEILSIAIRKDADYVLYSSDHGEFIGENFDSNKNNDLYGHNLLHFDLTNVPFLMYSKKNNKEMFNKLRLKKFISHNEISFILANLIGYDVKNLNTIGNKKDNLYFVHDTALIGDYRTIPYTISENGEIIQKPTTSVKKILEEVIAFANLNNQDKQTNVNNSINKDVKNNEKTKNKKQLKQKHKK